MHTQATSDVGLLTRSLLWLLALLELAAGAVALIAAVRIFRAPNAGMALIFAPPLSILALLLVAGAAIFVRRPLGRRLHTWTLALIGLLLVVFVGPLLGPFGWLLVLGMVLIVVGPLIAIVRLPSVRRYFADTTQ